MPSTTRSKSSTLSNMDEIEGLVKRLLLPIQNSISKLATAEHIDSKISELQTHVEGKLKEQDDKIEKINEKIEKMEGYISFMENALDQQNRHIDDLEQYGRRLCLRYIGIPVVEDENADSVLEKVKEIVANRGVTLPDSAYDRAHRIGPVKKDDHGQKQQTVIVKLTTWSARTMIYRAREKGKSAKVRIRLDLTKQRLKLLNDAEDVIKNEGMAGAGCYVCADVNCRLCVIDQNGHAHYFSCMREFNDIMEEL